MIKFDLHIHSSASKYKESKGIVDESTVDNIKILIDNLIENDIQMFSITDHNRFNKELYIALDKYLNQTKTKISLMSGIEFDVLLDNAQKPCHIISIFNTNNKEENYDKINKTLQELMLKHPEEYYTKEDFNNLLSKINLDVILIANQQSDIDNTKHYTRSLNNSCLNPSELISTGYISALEFQKFKVEGILKNNLNALDQNIALIAGSDCHTWAYYPQHDKSKLPRNPFYSEAEILPTFKGLLMAITSPQTRFNRYNSTSPLMIKNISINGTNIKLKQGINVIIGENGSGKSTLLDIIYDNKLESYEKKIKRDNHIIVDKIETTNPKYIAQSEIVTSFNNQDLLYKDKNFRLLEHSFFKKAYTTFAQRIIDYINYNISLKEKSDQLNEMSLELKTVRTNKSHYIIAENNDSQFTNIRNPHTTPRDDLIKLKSSLEQLLNKPYFQRGYKKELENILNILNEIYTKVSINQTTLENEILIRNIIFNQIRDYSTKITSKTSTDIIKKRKYRENITNFNEKLVSYLKQKTNPPIYPKKPDIISNLTKETHKGFEFQNISLYNEIDVSDKFLSKMFNKGYQNLDSICDIKTQEELKEAVRGCSDIKNIQESYSYNLKKFLTENTQKSTKYILESQGSRKIGDTLGELSLAYIKFITQEKNFNVLLIDQPEDNISNKNISSNLLPILDSIRQNSQIIIATHNPLLVVNLDVDNVINLNLNNKKLTAIQGPLEYEDKNINILDIISNTMDGGKDAIQRRLKVYECNH